MAGNQPLRQRAGDFAQNLRANGSGDDVRLGDLSDGILAVAVDGAHAVDLLDAGVFAHHVDLIVLLVRQLIDQRLINIGKG